MFLRYFLFGFILSWTTAAHSVTNYTNINALVAATPSFYGQQGYLLTQTPGYSMAFFDTFGWHFFSSYSYSTSTPTETFTSTSSMTPTNTATPTITNTFTSTNTNTATNTSTATVTSTFTPVDTNTSTYTPSSTNTPVDTSTFTQTLTDTSTLTSTETYTLTFTITPTNTITDTPQEDVNCSVTIGNNAPVTGVSTVSPYEYSMGVWVTVGSAGATINTIHLYLEDAAAVTQLNLWTAFHVDTKIVASACKTSGFVEGWNIIPYERVVLPYYYANNTYPGLFQLMEWISTGVYPGCAPNVCYQDGEGYGSYCIELPYQFIGCEAPSYYSDVDAVEPAPVSPALYADYCASVTPINTPVPTASATPIATFTVAPTPQAYALSWPSSWPGNGTTNLQLPSTVDVCSNFSICMWLNPQSTGGIEPFNIGGSLSYYPNNYASSNNSEVLMSLWSTDSSFSGGATLTQNAWSYVVITVSSSNGAICYQNGVSTGGNPDAVSINAGSVPLLWGSGIGGGTAYDGYMDEMLVFNRVLSPTEVSTLYNGGAGLYGNMYEAPWNNQLMAGWHCDEGSGGTAVDFTGNNFNISLPGGIDWVPSSISVIP